MTHTLMGNTASLCQEAAADPRSEVAESKLVVDAATQAAVIDVISDAEKPILATSGALEVEPPADEASATTEAEEAQAEADAAAEEEEEEEGKATITLSTAPVDPRFNTANASRYCYVTYNEAHRCFQERGEDSPECARYARTYRSICPSEWIAAWNEAREAGTWWGKY